MTRGHGTALADRLLGLCEADLAGREPRADGDGAGRTSARPLVIATIDLEALLDRTRTPGWLLHTVAGGRMQVTSATLQRLVDARGADLRTIVLDDGGEVVGIGTRSQIPPRALREAMWARDLAVRDPDGSTPVRRGDLDHIIPWPAVRPTSTTWSHSGGGGTTARPPRPGPSTGPVTAPPSGGTAGTAGRSGWPHPAVT